MMSALDQAFIKAYRQQASPGAASAAAAAQRLPLAEVVEDAAPPQVARPSPDRLLAALESPSAAGPAAPGFQPRLYEGPPTGEEDEAPSDKPEAGPERAACRAPLPVRSPESIRGGRRPAAPGRRPTPIPPTLGQGDLSTVIPLYRPEDRRDEDQETACEEPAGELSEGSDETADAVACVEPIGGPAADADRSEPVGEPADAAPSPGPPALPAARAEAFQPLLQVDSFARPDICRRLEVTAGVELQRLAEWLLERRRGGRCVVAVAARRRGEGATTVLLAVAARLAALGARVAMVDGDLGQPQLARRLGLLPAAGWEAVLTGRLPLAEVAVESAENRATLVPTREAFGGAGVPLGHEAAMSETLRALAAACDVVLVDVGPLEDSAVVEGVLGRGMAPQLDGVVLVRNVRSTDARQVAEVEAALRSAGIAPLGMVENLVRDE
jgi:Mrp family chromosome partitioning ATPase